MSTTVLKICMYVKFFAELFRHGRLSHLVTCCFDGALYVLDKKKNRIQTYDKVCIKGMYKQTHIP